MSVYADDKEIAAFDGSGAPLQLGSAIKFRPVRRDESFGSAVYQTSFPLPAASKLINFIATLQTLEGVSVSSAPVTLTVKAVDQSPGITLNDPIATGGLAPRLGHDITITANATVPGSPIVGANYVGTQKIADVASPTVYEFDFTPSATGNIGASALVTDLLGVSASSPPLDSNVLPDIATVTVIAAGNGTAVEHGGSQGKAFVMRAGDASLPLTVLYKVGGSAVENVDYKQVSGRVTIPAGESKAKIKIKPLNNSFVGTRKVKIKLLPAKDDTYTVGDPAVAKIKVVSD